MERDAIGPEVVRDALAELLRQPPLKKSPQLSAFLSYVVEESLGGRGGLLKSYTIATDALGRAPSFDPATDAIVRVEARRLRQVLQQIYDQPTCALTVRIDLPLGRYEPTFTRVAAPGALGPASDPAASLLRESEQRYRALVEASAAVEWRASPDGHLLRGFGWTACTGESEDGVSDQDWLDALHPADRSRAAGAWTEALAAGVPLEITVRVRHRGGAYRWMLARGLPLQNLDGSVREWVGTLTDIHDQVTAEEIRRARDESLRLAVEAAGLAVFEIDPATRAVLWSPGASELIGVSAGTLEAWTGPIDPADAPEVTAAFERVLRGEGAVDVVYRLAAPGGRPRWIACRGNRMATAAGEIRVFGVACDVTGAKVLPRSLPRDPAGGPP
ncbi:PAS domain-containing protein [Methylobacterium sp. ID0610]|uniref:PAS domain-containing protein n=1 Tax=Methylobacterium carpenticola TaxID=3344827 RepID=UPI0036A4F307